MGGGSRPPPLLPLLLTVVSVCAADFTTQCPSVCRCTWSGGKKVADCSDWPGPGLPASLSSDIQVLDLSGGRVNELGEDALQRAGLVNLQRLLLARTGLQTLHRHAFRGLELLAELDLADNQLTSVDTETFADNVQLRQLSLSGNRLQKLNDLQFPELPRIQQLNLSHCQLATISQRAFKKLTNLAELNLDGNKLAVLDPVIFQSLTKLNSLTLRDNPWRCDCHLRLFRDWLVQHKLYQLGTTCVEPERLIGKRWIDASSEEFACRPQITIPEPTVVADIGQNVTLRCQISGNPAAETKWVLSGGRILRNNTPVRGTDRLYIIHEEGNVNRWTNLTVTRVGEQDAGQYLCVGSNAGGVVEHNVTLVFRTAVEAAPGGSDGLLQQPALIGAVAGGAALLLVLLVISCWCCCRRGRRSDKQSSSTTDSVMVLNHKTSNGSGYEKLPQTERQTDVQLERLGARAELGQPGSSVMCNATEPPALGAAAAGARRRSLTDSESGRRDFPDLLHLPRSGRAGFESSLAAEPAYQPYPPAGRSRPAYVTLPRRPRTPSWGNSPLVTDPVYDTLGPRTTVDGSSRLSLTSVGQERPPVYYVPVENRADPAAAPATSVFATMPRAPRPLSHGSLSYAGHARSISTELIEPLTEEPEEVDEPPPPPPGFNSDEPLLPSPTRPAPAAKPKKVAPPPVPPKPRVNGAGVPPVQGDGVDGTEV
ncbi:Leucine-rich repeat, immunoglobulin-like domain and transmembrane domain-containing protein 3 [Amphibalanus amphitrite]|uniref:Leucine-rich repeat, immunoglobulin-like domain and transmembrane domain-containing protein 3 n=1 Tax=Amphibalanus amphitrite TaxID=1232801 RepID=A0A6A4WY51_AMPAM|nr:leucine-rich repeat-containing protein 24-like [Amphibalanus amphitrite]KAF0311835.1 Leucine-rich repeat, immunoglobulin-like domain and transmembrane domain-containing protein 3 [Amphibalanus amphitrite]